MKHIVFLLAIVCCRPGAYAQLLGNYSVPGSFASLAAAISSLNTAGVSGPVTINIAAAYTETAPVGGYSLYALAGVTATSQVVFQKSGAGANPLLIAYTGTYLTGAAVQDAIFRFIGADYITMNGIDLLDLNTSAPGTMELGYSLCRVSASDACQYNIIENCVITLNNQNTGPINNSFQSGGSRAIDLVNSTAGNYTAGIVPTNTAGSACYNAFYNNLLQNCFTGINITGNTSGSSSLNAYLDNHNNVGGLSAATSNTIVNYTGFAVKTWGQDLLNVSYNIINNTAGGGLVTSSVRGILINDAYNCSASVNNNTITVSTTSQPIIESHSGDWVSATGTSSVSISNNLLLNCELGPTPTNSDQYGISQGANIQNLRISNNKFQNLVSHAAGGDMTFIYANGSAAARCRIDSNDMSASFVNPISSGGEINGIYDAAGSYGPASISYNRFSNILVSYTTATGDVSYIKSYNCHGPLDISHNVWDNLAIKNTGVHQFIYNEFGSSPLLTVTNNSILTGYLRNGPANIMSLCNLSASGTSTGTSIHRVADNNFSNITSTVASGYSSFSGFTFGNLANTPVPSLEVSGNVLSNINYNTNGETRLLDIAYSISTATVFTAYTSAPLIHGNFINNLSTNGDITTLRLANSTQSLQVYSNSVTAISSSGSVAAVYGVYVYDNISFDFYKNKIGNIASSGGGVAYGLYLAAPVFTTSAAARIFNNLIGDIRAPLSSSNSAVNGLYLLGGASIKCYYNTVFLNAASSGSVFGSNALYVSSSPTLDLQNNIVVNTSTAVGTGTTCAFRRSAASLSTFSSSSNSNLFYAGSPFSNRLIYYDGTSTYTSLANYKSAVFPREYFSVTELAPFASTITSSANYLALSTTAPTQAESSANPIASYTDDIAGTVRNVNHPDMGAWEGNYTGNDLLAPVLLASGFTSGLCNLTSRTFTANFVDLSGVASGPLSPRVYYKVNSGSYSSTQGTLTSGTATNGIWTFTLNYLVGSYDVVSYYVLAQDIAPLTNLLASPSTGFTGINVNSVTSPPTLPSAYTIGSVLNGTYTVGSGGTYTTLTAAANAYNLSCLAGPVTFSLISSLYSTGESFPITFSNNPNASATNSLLIIPAGTSTVQGSSSAGSVIKFVNANYITLDGVNANGSSLALNNPNSGASANVWIGSGASSGPGNNYVTVKNLSLNGGTTTYTNHFGVYIGQDGFNPTRLAGIDNDNIAIRSNTISMVNTGIYACGSASISVGGMNNLDISNNVIGPAVSSNTNTMPEGSGLIVSKAVSPVIVGNMIRNFYTYVDFTSAMDLRYMTSAAVSQNTIQNIFGYVNTFASTSGPISLCGMYLGTSVISSTISANTISTVWNATYPGYGTRGLAIKTDELNSQDRIYNNMISGVYNTPNYSESNWPAGIAVTGNSYSLDIAFNSVHMYGSYTATPGQHYATSAYYDDTGASLLRNNIFSNDMYNVNGNDAAYALYFFGAPTSTAYTVMDYNDYHVSSGSPLAGVSGSSISTLSGIQSAFGGNVHSVTVTPGFVSNSDLHIAAVSGNLPLENLGSPLPGITSDIDAQGRNAATPDIGADEFTIPVCTSAGAGSITLLSASVCVGQTVTLTTSGYATGVNAGFQWEAATTAGGTYTTLNTGTGVQQPTYSFVASSPGTLYYKLFASCSTSTVAAVSNEATLTAYVIPTVSISSPTLPLCSHQDLHLAGASTAGSVYSWWGPNSFTSAVQNPTLVNVDINASGVYSLMALNGTCPSPVVTATINIIGTPGTLSVSPFSTLMCSANPQTLAVSGGIFPAVYSFTPQSSQNTATTFPAPYSAYAGGQKMQLLVRATELTAAGLVAGPLTSIRFPVISLGSAWGTGITADQNFQVSLGLTGLNALGSTFQNGLTVVVPAGSFTPAAGYANVHYFATPFNWDGVSNLVVETVFSNNSVGSSAYAVLQYFSPTSYQSTLVYAAANQPFAVIAAATASNMVIGLVRPDFKLTGSKQGTYSWSPSSSLSSSTGSLVIATPVANTAYSVSVNNNGCISSAIVPVTVAVQPSLYISASNTSVCPGASATLTGAGAGSFTWSNGSTANSILVSPTLSSVYSISTQVSPCPPASASITIVPAAPPVVLIAASSGVFCSEHSYTLNASGAFSYQWNTGATGPNLVITASGNTSYSVTGTSQQGCQAQSGFIVSSSPSPTVSVSPASATLCAGESAQFTASGADNYLWQPTNATATVISLTPSVSASYTLTGINTNGCSGTALVDVFVDLCQGIKNVSFSGGITVYPNPTHDLVEVQADQPMRLYLINSLGQLMQSHSIDGIAISLSMAGLPNGVYLLKVVSDRQIRIVRIIKE